MRESVRQLIKDDDGPTAVEYAIIVGGIALVIIGAVYAFGSQVNSKLDNAGKSLTTGR